MTTIVFSKDRAMQLHAFLRSYERHVTPLGKVYVVYLATSERHILAYAEALAQFSFVVMVPQCGSFKTSLLYALSRKTGGGVVFFVDDQIFVRPWIVLEKPGLSLRLGLNLTSNYNSGDAQQSLPPYEVLEDDRICWRWANGMLAWAYPMSLDGHVFDLAMTRVVVASLEFGSPNTLESGLQRFDYLLGTERGTCYRESKVVNVPWNIVQTDWHNRHAADDTGVETMLDQWEGGYQISLDHIDGVLNESVHQEFPLVLERRC